MFRDALLICFLLLVGAAAHAGEPVEETMRCPVGKKPFKIVSTLSCSTMGATISMREITSCEFITHLPVCPANGLPVYREFDKGEIKELKALLKTEDYQALLAQPDYFRAYSVERHLKPEGSGEAFWLLQRGLWLDHQKMEKVPDLGTVFLKEANQEKNRVSEDEKPYFLAAVGYQLLRFGNVKEAKRWLRDAKDASDGSDFLSAYIRAVTGCIGNMAKERCKPDAPFEP